MTEEYNIVPLHRRPELIKDCCKLLNSEWPRSETARLKSLKVSCDNFPTCLILVDRENRVIGHCKISLVPSLLNSCFIESVVIACHRRSLGLGSKLLRGAEEYVASKGIKNMYLMTRGQELFYFKNGYDVYDPVKLLGFSNFLTSVAPAPKKHRNRNTNGTAPPPPPPMPNLQIPKAFDILIERKTHMVKRL